MKKNLLAITVLLLSTIAVSAQQFRVEKSGEFDIPAYGWNKLMQLKNGNTFYFHSSRRDGLEVTIYNKQRKQIASKELDSKLWNSDKMNTAEIEGLYEINGQPVIFIAQGDGRTPVLYRMQLNPNTGAIAGEAKVGELAKISLTAGYKYAFGGSNYVLPQIVVEKDPNSDCYAAIFFDGLSNKPDRIRAIHFNGNHKVISNATYVSPNGQYKSLNYIGATVDGNKRIFVSTYGYNGEADEDKDAVVLISRLNAGATKFDHTTLQVSTDFANTKAIMRMNPKTNKLIMMTSTYDKLIREHENVLFGTSKRRLNRKKKESFLTILSVIDPDALNVTANTPVLTDKIDDYGKANIDKDFEYVGAPQNIVMNKDSKMTILMEDITGNDDSWVSSGDGHTNRAIYTTLGPIGISELSETGEVEKAYALNKSQKCSGLLPGFYNAERANGKFKFTRGLKGAENKQYISFDYVYTDNNSYVLYNELPSNAEREEEDQKRRLVSDFSHTNTMCYQLAGSQIKKTFLFGEPADDKSSTCILVESSDFNKSSNTYATLIEERSKNVYLSKIAWITFE